MVHIESDKQRLLSEEDGGETSSTEDSIDLTTDLPFSSTFCSTFRPRQNRWSVLGKILLWIFLLTSLTVNVLLYFNPGLHIRSPEAICRATIGEKASSPIIDDMFITYDTVKYNGSLLKENIYKKAPAPEVDLAWDALAVQNVPFIIPEDQGEKYGLSKSHVKRRPEAGGGYSVYLEAMHHLHCLNLLRQTSYWNYEYYLKEGKGPFVNSEPIIKFHAGHCLDILRQQLMCKADLSVFGQVWVQDYGIYPDFDTKHRCKNFDAIRNWVKDRQLRKQLDSDGNSIFEIREGDEVLDEIP